MEILMSTNAQEGRLLTPSELAAAIKMLRLSRGWSQEQLAEISGLSVRTIQRIEQNMPSSFDTRRAIAKAFGCEDIDFLNKLFVIPTEEQIAAEKKKFEQEYITLDVAPLTSGKQLAQLVENNMMDLSTSAFEMDRAADEEFAALIDWHREYRDIADCYSESQKFEVYDALQAHIDELKRLGVSLRYAERKLVLKLGGPDGKSNPMAAKALYVVAFPLGQEPQQFSVPRATGIKM
jgi:transcriptional regulator with XRE-family HTH domain